MRLSLAAAGTAGELADAERVAVVADDRQQIVDPPSDVGLAPRVKGLRAEPLGRRAPFRHRIHPDHAPHTEVAGDPRRHLPDGPEAEHGQGAAVRDVGAGDRLVGRRQDVRQTTGPRAASRSCSSPEGEPSPHR